VSPRIKVNKPFDNWRMLYFLTAKQYSSINTLLKLLHQHFYLAVDRQPISFKWWMTTIAPLDKDYPSCGR